MKKLLLLLAAMPSLSLAVPITLDESNSDFSAFTRSGYRVEHSSATERSAGLSRWWVSFFSVPGTGFDAYSFGGQMQNLLQGANSSAVLVQGETVDGDYYSQIFRFKPDATDASLLTAALGDQFRNLSWLRISGFGHGSDFALKDLEVNGVENVPETAPGVLLMTFALGALLVAHAGISRKRTVS